MANTLKYVKSTRVFMAAGMPVCLIKRGYVKNRRKIPQKSERHVGRILPIIFSSVHDGCEHIMFFFV